MRMSILKLSAIYLKLHSGTLLKESVSQNDSEANQQDSYCVLDDANLHQRSENALHFPVESLVVYRRILFFSFPPSLPKSSWPRCSVPPELSLAAGNKISGVKVAVATCLHHHHHDLSLHLPSPTPAAPHARCKQMIAASATLVLMSPVTIAAGAQLWRCACVAGRWTRRREIQRQKRCRLSLASSFCLVFLFFFLFFF